MESDIKTDSYQPNESPTNSHTPHIFMPDVILILEQIHILALFLLYVY